MYSTECFSPGSHSVVVTGTKSGVSNSFTTQINIVATTGIVTAQPIASSPIVYIIGSASTSVQFDEFTYSLAYCTDLVWTYSTTTLPLGVTFTQISDGTTGGEFDIYTTNCAAFGTHSITVTGETPASETDDFTFQIDMQFATGFVTATALDFSTYTYSVGSSLMVIQLSEFTYSQACGNTGWTYTTSSLPSGVTFMQISDGTTGGSFSVYSSDIT